MMIDTKDIVLKVFCNPLGNSYGFLLCFLF